jgi:hypothetical protein
MPKWARICAQSEPLTDRVPKVRMMLQQIGALSTFWMMESDHRWSQKVTTAIYGNDMSTVIAGMSTRALEVCMFNGDVGYCMMELLLQHGARQGFSKHRRGWTEYFFLGTGDGNCWLPQTARFTTKKLSTMIKILNICAAVWVFPNYS